MCVASVLCCGFVHHKYKPHRIFHSESKTTRQCCSSAAFGTSLTCKRPSINKYLLNWTLMENTIIYKPHTISNKICLLKILFCTWCALKNVHISVKVVEPHKWLSHSWIYGPSGSDQWLRTMSRLPQQMLAKLSKGYSFPRCIVNRFFSFSHLQ